MIYCVWYPSGGFGHFVNAVLTLYGNRFARPKQNTLEFSESGHSHALDLVVPKYNNNRWSSNMDFDHDVNYSVLIDNGITDENDLFRSQFVDSTVIKICYTDLTWPIVARCMIDKAMQSDIETQLPIHDWPSDAAWAKREKYFLYLRDHAFRQAWKPGQDPYLLLDQMLDYSTMFDRLNEIVVVGSFEPTWNRWREANARYIQPISLARHTIECVKNSKNLDLSAVSDVWSQAVIYYYLWLYFDREVPHNTYSEFFQDADQIRAWLHEAADAV